MPLLSELSSLPPPALLIVGGGLAGTLLGLALTQAHPGFPFWILDTLPWEQRPLQTWSCHASDLSPAAREWLAPWLEKTWPAYTVRFPFSTPQTIPLGYHSLSAPFLFQKAGPVLRPHWVAPAQVIQVEPQAVTLAGGERLQAPLVLDARGLPSPLPYRAGFQKFAGALLESHTPHGLTLPRLMEASSPASYLPSALTSCDFRFFYVLPWSPTQLLVEETWYSASPSLDVNASIQRCQAYAAHHWKQDWKLVNQEQGCLPLPLEDPCAWAHPNRQAVPILGTRAGFFHDITGYSLPWAIEVALTLVRAFPLAHPRAVQDILFPSRPKQAPGIPPSRSFFQRLNRFFFHTPPPQERHRLLAYFYGLPTPLIRSFYRGHLSLAEKAGFFLSSPCNALALRHTLFPHAPL